MTEQADQPRPWWKTTIAAGVILVCAGLAAAIAKVPPEAYSPVMVAGLGLVGWGGMQGARRS